MASLGNINIQRLSNKAILKIADEMLAKLNPDEIIPVPIDQVIEISMGYTIIPCPNLKNSSGCDAALAIKDNEIYIDEGIYMSDKNKRYKFTLAHELAHIILHNDLFMQLDSYDKDIDFHKKCSDEIVFWLEWQADTFAGYFLSPSKIFVPLANEWFAPLRKAKLKINDDIIEYAADAVKEKAASHFDISPPAAKARLRAYLRHGL